MLLRSNYARASQQQSAFVLSGRIEHGAVLITLVQGVISTFHENFGPFHETGGEETTKRADKDFLEEGGVHPFLRATMMPVTKVFMKMLRLSRFGHGSCRNFLNHGQSSRP
jgi:hypothetical protein